MVQLNDKPLKPSGKPVKPKKPPPTKESPAEVPVPCPVLTEERIREIVKDEMRAEVDRKNSEFWSREFASYLLPKSSMVPSNQEAE